MTSDESQALIDVYTLNELETPEPTKKVNGKVEHVPHYEWEGVVCNNSKCIEKIFFENMTLSRLPKSLFSMNDLKELWLEGNQLTVIPQVTGLSLSLSLSLSLGPRRGSLTACMGLVWCMVGHR